MNPHKHVLDAMHRFALCWPNHKPTVETVELYVEILGEIEPGLLQAASVRLCRTLKFFPTPKEILDAVAAQSIAAWQERSGREHAERLARMAEPKTPAPFNLEQAFLAELERRRA